MLYAIVGMLVIILDQGVKYWITSNFMVDSVTQPLIPGVISLVRVHNDGAAFSFLAGGGARIYFIILTAVFTIAVIIALATNFINGRFGRWCLVIVTAGGLSNCLDRVLYGYVVDMFKVDLFNFAVFNVADIFITVFSILFIIYIIFGGESKPPEHYDEFDEEDDEDADRPSYKIDLKGKKKSRKAERDELPEKSSKERAADARAKKYRTEDDDEVDSPRFGGYNKKKARRSDDEEEAAPAKTRSSVAGKQLEGFGTKAAAESKQRGAKQKKTLYEEDYEQYKAEHPEMSQTAKKSTAANKANLADNDPFAEWERANARVESRQTTSATAKAMGVNSEKKSSADDDDADLLGFEAPVVKRRTPGVAAQSTAAPKTEAAVAPKATAAPAADSSETVSAKPAAAAKKPAASSDDFSLDDILNEFK